LIEYLVHLDVIFNFILFSFNLLKISIVRPSFNPFNQAVYLGEAPLSLTSQAYDNLELIVIVDDEVVYTL